MSIADKIQKLKTIKSSIKDAIYNKGVAIDDTTPFADYPDKINSIVGKKFMVPNGLQFWGVNSDDKKVPSYLDFSNVTDARNMFTNTVHMVESPVLPGKFIYANNMFTECPDLQKVNLFNTSAVTDVSYMFRKCTALKTIPQFDLSKVTNFKDMLSYCSSLESVPVLDCSSGNSYSNMFFNCSSLKNIPGIKINDSVSVATTTNMFWGCSSLEYIPALSTGKVRTMSAMFEGCSSLKTIESLNISSVTMQYVPQDMFKECSSLENIKFAGTINTSVNFSDCVLLTYASVKSILTAASKTTNKQDKTLSFNVTLADRGGELAGLVSACTAKSFTITGLTIE